MNMGDAKVVELGDRAIDTILLVQNHVKLYYYQDDIRPIDNAVALAFVPEHITATGTIYIVYVYIYEGETDRHTTGIFTDLTKAVQVFLDAKRRLDLNKDLGEFIDPR